VEYVPEMGKGGEVEGVVAIQNEWFMWVFFNKKKEERYAARAIVLCEIRIG